MSAAIKYFHKEYLFLSTFFPICVTFRNITFPTIQHALVAAMTEDMVLQVKISQLLTPQDAVKLSKVITPFQGYTAEYRLAVLKNLIDQVFDPNKHPDMAKKLCDTGEAELINTDLWGDDFLGIVVGKGENHYGKALMEKRKDLLGK